MPVSSGHSPWIVGAVSPSASFRLFCFPYAGLGASAYRTWAGRLGSTVDVCAVQLPGRESRQAEPPMRRMEELADAAADGLAPYFDMPFALFGHSMGALVAFEVAKRHRNHPLLRRLFVSARRAPHLPDPLPTLVHLSDAAFVAAVQQRYGGIPDAVLGCAELLELLLPRLRADFEILEGYACGAAEPLVCPVSVFGGTRDTIRSNDLQEWNRHTHADIRLRMLDAEHLYLQDQRQILLQAIADDLALRDVGCEVGA